MSLGGARARVVCVSACVHIVLFLAYPVSLCLSPSLWCICVRLSLRAVRVRFLALYLAPQVLSFVMFFVEVTRRFVAALAPNGEDYDDDFDGHGKSPNPSSYNDGRDSFDVADNTLRQVTSRQ